MDKVVYTIPTPAIDVAGVRKMNLKALLEPVFQLAARACEKSGLFCTGLRSLNFRGKGRIIQRIKPESIARQVTADCGGVLFRLDLGEDVQRELYFDIYERLEIKNALSLIPTGGTCLDVGANNGAFALQFAKRVGEQGRVHAFEPDPLIFHRLKVNCELNHFEQRLICHNMAVSNRNETLTFYKSPESHSGWGSFSQFSDIETRSEVVQATTLDTFLASQNIFRVDFLKVDVEAHEPELLEGARLSLANQVFRHILIEFNGLRLGQRGKSLEQFLSPMLSAGYRLIRPGPDAIQKMTTGAVSQESVLINFLLVRQE